MLHGTRRCAIPKLYVVRLTKQERGEPQSVVKKLKGTGQKLRRAQILLKADADGPNWTDQRIADAFSCFPDIETLREETVAWSKDVNTTQRGVDWQMKIDEVRAKLKSVYPTIKL